MSHLIRHIVPLFKWHPHRALQTSCSKAGAAYSELTDYTLYLWDRPAGFIDGQPPKEHFWERRSYNTFLDKYWLAMLVGVALAFPYVSYLHRVMPECGDEAVKIAEERLQNGVLIDLFPDQKEAKLFVANREFFPDHDPHTYDPTIEREYFWIQ